MVDVSACNDLKEEEGFEQPGWSCHNSLHHRTGSPQPPTLPAPSRSPCSTLCTCTVGGARAQLTVHLPPGEQEKPACPRVIDYYGTTASGIMLAGAIYKQKHSVCLCQLQRILPFLSQIPLERARHRGSNVIFYWESTIPHIEMAKESY